MSEEMKHLVITVYFAYMMEYHATCKLFWGKTLTCNQIQGYFFARSGLLIAVLGL